LWTGKRRAGDGASSIIVGVASHVVRLEARAEPLSLTLGANGKVRAWRSVVMKIETKKIP